MIPGQPLADDLPHGQIDALAVVHSLAIVESERLLIEIPEQVEGLDGNVGSLQPALEQGPEVLHAVGVDFAAYVLDRMVNHFMLELIQSIVRP
jgi:hypothetical protein